MNKIGILFLALIFLTDTSCERKFVDFETQIDWQNFYFKSDTFAGVYLDKYAMIVPVTIEKDTTVYEMQFDTGANMTEFYENPIRGINSVASKIDTFNINKYSVALSLTLDEFESQVNAFPIRKDFGAKNSKHIGTIGSNEFENKILIIDYPRQKFAILDSLQTRFKKDFELIDFHNPEGQIYLKLKINNKSYNFLFDTGSSTTPLLTNMNLYNELTGEIKEDIDTIRAKSWGVDVTAPGAKNMFSIYIGNSKLKSNMRIYGTDTKHTIEFLKNNNLDGLISNPYFFEDIILIDFKNKKFGIRH